ncbi:MAG: hypothetical protein HKM06_06040 [Spirochaetales bacterium]|nr:hypothetical protein [Spirochaetales bacterium]
MKRFAGVLLLTFVTAWLSAQSPASLPPTPPGAQTLSGILTKIIPDNTTKKTSAFLVLDDASGKPQTVLFPATATLNGPSGDPLRFNELRRGNSLTLAVRSLNGQNEVVWAVRQE